MTTEVEPQRFTNDAELDNAFNALGLATSRDHYDEMLGKLRPLVADRLDTISECFDRGNFPRFAVLWCMIGVTSADAISLMCRGITDSDKYTRWAAAEALAKCNTPESTAALVNALRDRSSLVKGVSVNAMKRLRPLSAVPLLRKIVESRYQNAHSPGTVSDALMAIHLIENVG